MYKYDISEILGSFVPISLNEMDRVKLMNRVDSKYVFAVNKLPDLLGNLSGSYRVLDIDQIKVFPYHTTYLDTPEFLFFSQHLRGKLNRYKIRFRRYESTGISFLEIKKKTNRNKTIKWRIENSSDTNCPNQDASTFISEYLPYKNPALLPVLINRYTRVTLVDKNVNERLTLDFNLEFGSPEGKNVVLPFLAVAELKSEGNTCQSHFLKTMKQFCIRPGGFSKYCIGSTLVREMPRTNILKQNLLQIKKIENEYI
jgi:hypothetical protein